MNAATCSSVVVALCLVVAGCGHRQTYSELVAGAHDRGAIGSVRITRADGTVTASPLQLCQSGELAMFQGVDLASIDPAVTARVAVDPIAGPRIQLDTLAVGAPWVLDASLCPTWDISVAPRSSWINRVRELDVVVSVACALPDGMRVALSADVRCSIDRDVFTVRNEIGSLRSELSP